MCPCKYPFVTLKKGIIRIAKEIILITNAISDTVFPPVAFPIINFPICGANKNKRINITIDIIDIIFNDTL